MLNLAYNVTCGGARPQDIERLRHDTAYMNALGAELTPDPTTAGDFCRRFTETDVATLMEAIKAVRARLWADQAANCSARSPTSTPTAPSPPPPASGHLLQGHLGGYSPLIVSLANTKEVLLFPLQAEDEEEQQPQRGPQQPDHAEGSVSGHEAVGSVIIRRRRRATPPPTSVSSSTVVGSKRLPGVPPYRSAYALPTLSMKTPKGVNVRAVVAARLRLQG